MIGLLSDDEITDLLRRHRIGRLGCTVNDRPYVVPIRFAFDGTHIYGYSGPGRKISVMREQPLICFEVDEVTDESTWRSLIGEGRYEELTDERERAHAARLLSNGNGNPAKGIGTVVSRSLSNDPQIILFRLRIDEVSGRFERRDA